MTSQLWCFMKRGKLAASCHPTVAQAHSENWMKVIKVIVIDLKSASHWSTYLQESSMKQNRIWIETHTLLELISKKTRQIDTNNRMNHCNLVYSYSNLS